MQQTRVATVGLGGTGSLITEQLAHLGVTGFLLIDPDTVDETNLNRLVEGLPAPTSVRRKPKLLSALFGA
jgi:molybdopterin-synthase adenylyltransferase